MGSVSVMRMEEEVTASVLLGEDEGDDLVQHGFW